MLQPRGGEGAKEGPKGWAMVFPETWNLEPETLWRGQNAEVRGQGKPEQPEQPFNAKGANETQRAQEEEGRPRRGIVDAPAGRIGSEGNGTASALGERSYRAELFFGFYRLRIFCGVCVFCVEWFLNSSAAGRRRSTLKTGTAMNSLCAQRAQLQNSRAKSFV